MPHTPRASHTVYHLLPNYYKVSTPITMKEQRVVIPVRFILADSIRFIKWNSGNLLLQILLWTCSNCFKNDDCQIIVIITRKGTVTVGQCLKKTSSKRNGFLCKKQYKKRIPSFVKRTRFRTNYFVKKKELFFFYFFFW